MARKSRKNMPVAVAEPTDNLTTKAVLSMDKEAKPYQVGIYARLSFESEANKERDTVDTQIAYIREFINSQDDMVEVEVYADISVTGTTFERPEFDRMIQDIRAGRINTVITRDLSRLGRNYVEAGNYIERVFPFLDVRYIAITDDFDTARPGTDLSVPLKNIVNEYYSKDLSKKVETGKHSIWAQGGFSEGTPPYGYYRATDGSRKLLIDEEVSDNVVRIFNIFLDGKGYAGIAKTLQNEGILSPPKYRFYKSGKIELAEKAREWHYSHVKEILQGEYYIGNIVHGKQRKALDTGRKNVKTDASTWQRIENVHEPIIDKDTFYKTKLLNQANISAASYTRQTKNQSSVMKAFKEKEIRFLCACNMISEGWDYPELGILVMARPTLSKVLYLQQVGRGLRKTDTKKNVIVIDVVDEYGAMIKPCSMHSVFANPYYVPFGDITKMDYKPGDLVVIDGMEERIERITEVDIHSFEEKYGDYLSQEQVAREYFVNTGTITSWIRAGKLTPEVQYKFGSKTLYLFSPDEVEKYRKQLGIKEHNDATIKEDFFAFLEERDYSLSYKMPFLLAFIRHVDSIGDAKIEEILEDYIAFYQDRITRGLPVDRSTCPYNETMLQDKKAMQRSMLTNPFEKFERKRFLYYSKDLSVISMNHALYSQMEAGDWKRVRRQMEEDLAEYYAKVEGAVVVKR